MELPHVRLVPRYRAVTTEQPPTQANLRLYALSPFSRKPARKSRWSLGGLPETSQAH